MYYEEIYLLNSNWEYFDTISWKRAVKLMFRGCVEVVKTTDIEIAQGVKLPKVLRLLKAVRKFYGRKVSWNKHNCFIRDDYSCQYCGEKLSREDATIDHVIPFSRGGKTEWDNCVTSCIPCNNKKDDRTPSEARMYLKRQPYTPTIMEFFRKKCKVIGIEQTLIDLGVY